MESKKLFEELFVEEENIEESAGATDLQCHDWYVRGVMGGCVGTGLYPCEMWKKYCSNPPRY